MGIFAAENKKKFARKEGRGPEDNETEANDAADNGRVLPTKFARILATRESRLAMIFAVLSNLLANVFAPAFARCQNPRKLRWQYAAIAGGVVCFSLVVLGAA